MRGALCKIWNFFLNLFNDVLDAVAYALTTVGEVLLKLAKGVGEVVGGVIGSVFGGSNLLVWAGVGAIAYFLFFKKDEGGDSNYTRTIDSKVKAGVLQTQLASGRLTMNEGI